MTAAEVFDWITDLDPKSVEGQFFSTFEQQISTYYMAQGGGRESARELLAVMLANGMYKLTLRKE